MTINTSAVLENEAQRIPIGELMSGAASFEWSSPPVAGGFSSTDERIRFEPDDCQIAFVSFHSRLDRDGIPRRAGKMGRLFLLPLTWREFVTRVQEGLAHSNASNENKIVRFGQVRIDLLSMEVRRSDCPVILTAMEFKVLKFFVSNPRQVISRDKMLDEVWGYDNYPCTRTVDNHVLKLRQKLEPEPAEPVHFRTVHGIGYKFIPDVS
jgi:DNA-binding winged helix-turn-helix (wHTH) protein